VKVRAFIPVVVLVCAAFAHAAAPSECWTQRKHGQMEQARACFESLMRGRDAASRAEGFWGLEQWDQANEQFRLAAAQPDSPAVVKVRWGLLLHERFNDAEAAALFREALQKDSSNAEAYLALATVSAGSFSGQAAALAAKAIEIDPKLSTAHELMADIALTNDDRDTAAVEADKALALAADAIDAMAIHATLHLLAEHTPEAWFAKIAAINPHDGEAYAHVARQLELHYRFQDAVTYYRKAIEVEPRLWSAHSALGIELMRLGQDEEPSKELELSYENGYRDAATVNSLRLLDSYTHFVTVRDDTTILKLDKSESDLLLPYLQSELHTILATYEKKYQMKLAGAVQVEVYPNHEDFAVRTMGMPGLGALGVTFGRVIAMDSPSARKPGDFNWGATLWHEMSHVFVLTATNFRVPRWFTEGLAVHEEGEHSAEWRNQPTPEILAAIRDKKLLPVARLDRGFVFPDYPAQIVVSYFQAGTICDYIQSKWGEPKLLEMVHAYAHSSPTPQVITQVLGVAAEDFDKRYLAWLDQKYGAEGAHFDAWREKLKSLVAAEQQEQYDTVLQQGPAVVAMYPEYVGDASAYEIIAEAAKQKGDSQAEAAILAVYRDHGGQVPSLLKRLATLEDAAGQHAEAAATLERVNYIYPVKDEDLHRRLGDLLYAQKQYDGAIREYNALVATHPVDKAGAEFSLAQAYFAAGQRAKAQESVLSALETAPGYRPAQKLLLELQEPASKTN
jgi:Tfp pilus assembly protein PilF